MNYTTRFLVGLWSPAEQEDFCAVCGCDLEPGPCAPCFLNQCEPDDSWRAEEDARKREEFYAVMGWN